MTIAYPEIDGGRKLNRWLPLVKWILAVPLYVVGILYLINSIVLVIVAWLSIVVSGKMPEYCADLILRTMQFWNCIDGYALLMMTDEYPTFKL